VGGYELSLSSLCCYVAVCVLQCVAVCYMCCSVHVAVCYSVLHCVAFCCSVLHCVAVCCSVLQCVYLCWRLRVVAIISKSQCVAVCVLHVLAVYCIVFNRLYSVLQCIASSRRALQCLAVSCSVLQCLVVSCSVLQYVHLCWRFRVVAIISALQCNSVCVAVCCSVL